MKDAEYDALYEACLHLDDGPDYRGECTICHQSDAADKGIPSIVGWPPDDFVIALHAYKRGKRVHPIMQLVAGRLSDEEIAALAAHFQRAEDDP